MKPTVAAAAVLLLLLVLAFSSQSQCVLSPVSLDQRVTSSSAIAQGKVVKKQTYIDASNGYVYTRNTVTINAWLKNHSSKAEIEIITLGGVFENKATEAYPSIQLEEGGEYVFFLEGNNFKHEDKGLRLQRPGVLQTMIYSDMQGAVKNEGNNYKELFARSAISEATLFSKITKLSKSRVLTPAGKEFAARKAVSVTNSNSRINALDAFSPTTVNSGTLLPADELTITGSGFGATAATVSFTDANNGGASFYTGLASDIVSWTDTEIKVKVPSRAGTGPIRVNSPTPFTSSTSLTVGYAHIAIDHNFASFAGTTSQRFFLRNLNTLGGYTFQFNNTFNANTAAVDAFNRALSTWVCATGINFRASGATAAVAANDGVNVVTYASLPVGVLGRATSNYTANATGACQLYNTVWWTEDIDVQFSDPPYAGFTWEYGPATPSGSEFDFETVTLHELGHAIGLAHRISPGAVMHYSVANGSAVRIPNAQDISAASAKLSYSTNALAPCFNPPGSGSAMTLSGCTLPVTFIAFSGERKDKSTDELYWDASHSNNNTGYAIERSADGENFKQVGFLSETNPIAAGQSYKYADNTAGIYPWYYRLKQTDLDGDYTYSKVIFIKGDNNSNWRVFCSTDGNTINLYGNPIGGKSIQFNLLTASGQVVMSKQVSNAVTTISASNLAKGVYYYKMVDSNNQPLLSGSLLLGGNN